jgi:hypothetical protein
LTVRRADDQERHKPLVLDNGAMAANSNSEWWGLMRNKLAVIPCAAATAFPSSRRWRSMRMRPRCAACRSCASLARADFLRAAREYPLFGKPMDPQRSRGSIGLEANDPGADCFLAGPDHTIPVEEFAAASA